MADGGTTKNPHRDTNTPRQFLTDTAHCAGKTICMPSILEPATIPKPTIGNKTPSEDDLATTCYAVCWNDPVNLMVDVTHVFMKVFGWQRQKAVRMREGGERADYYVHQLQGYPSAGASRNQRSASRWFGFCSEYPRDAADE
jgi:hypothetical protein